MRRLFALFLLLVSVPVLAAPTPNSFVSPQTPVNFQLQFTSASTPGGTFVTLATGAANGTKITGMWAGSSETATSHLIYCQYFHSTTTYGGTQVTLTASGGGTANIVGTVYNLMSPAAWPGLPLDSDGNPYLFLASGDTIQCGFNTAITATDIIGVIAQGANY